MMKTEIYAIVADCPERQIVIGFACWSICAVWVLANTCCYRTRKRYQATTNSAGSGDWLLEPCHLCL